MSVSLAKLEQELEKAEAQGTALQAKEAVLQAEKAAIEAVLDGEESAPEGVDAKIFNRYKKFPDERPSLKDIFGLIREVYASMTEVQASWRQILATIKAFEQQKANQQSKKPQLAFRVVLKYDGCEKIFTLENLAPDCYCDCLLSLVQDWAMEQHDIHLVDLEIMNLENVNLEMTAEIIASNCAKTDCGLYYQLEVHGKAKLDLTTFFMSMVGATFYDMLSVASTTSSVRENMRQKLLTANKTYEHCTVLEQVSKEIKFPQGCMSVGAHIIRRAKQLDSSLMLLKRLGLDEDHHGPRNGIIMTRSLEAQFDRLMWCFVPCGGSSGVVEAGMIPFRVRVFGFQPLVWENGNPRIDADRTKASAEEAKSMPIELVNKNGETLCDTGVTWGDLEGLVIQLPDSISVSAMMFHATATHIRHNQISRSVVDGYSNTMKQSVETTNNIMGHLDTVEQPLIRDSDDVNSLP